MIGMRTELPAGTVTLLFTDIEGSTRLLHELGPSGYAEALAEHRRVLRQAFRDRGGVEVDTQGDAFFYAFPDAAGAVEAALVGQLALSTGPIRVRLGIHTGTPHLTDEGYVGSDVNQGARIAAAGHGGQVLISAQTRELVDAEVSDLGEHRLKDFDRPVPIFQLGHDRFPPLKTISNTNLPRPASSFVGREREVADVVALLQGSDRLVTLTGPGGTGKTRLSIAAATDLLAEHRHGVFWVPLATLRDSSLVIQAIAKVLGAPDALADHIADKEMLLLLDNLEQVIDASPQLSSLLEQCPHLRLLVTSRELLRVRGEVEYAVPPLAEKEAVDLFGARSGLAPDAAISELCRRLDNLPLAVELAAARTKVLTPEQILQRLASRLDLLKGGRDADPRQATLRATIQWSHDLLDAQDVQLFARLSVFRGGCTLTTAEAVCDADLDVLQSLTEKSLVRHADDRFWMLETIREFAAEQLAPEQVEELHGRHTAFFVALVEEAETHLAGEAAEWLDLLAVEHDNVRAALDRLEQAHDTEAALSLAGGLSLFWEMRDHVAEARARYSRLLQQDDRATRGRARALNGACAMAVSTGDLDEAQQHGEQAMAMHRELGDARGTAMSQLELGCVHGAAGRYEQALRLFEQSAAGFREIGEVAWDIWATRMLAWMHDQSGDRETARDLHEHNLARARAAGNRYIEGSTVGALAGFAVEARQFGDALALLRESSRLNHLLGADHLTARNVHRLARVLVLHGRAAIAAELLGASAAYHDDHGFQMDPWLVDYGEKTLHLLREHLDREQQEQERQRGRRLSLSEAETLGFDEFMDALLA